MVERARDIGLTPESFQDRVLCVCPACGRGGLFTAERSRNGTVSWRFRCRSCTHASAGTTDRQPAYAAAGLVLLLRVDTRHGELRVHNEQELAYLAAYIAAPLREKAIEHELPVVRNGKTIGTAMRRTWSTRTVIARLPAWVTSAKNRDEMHKAFRRLAEIAASSGFPSDG